jgi:hypothetical protein
VPGVAAVAAPAAVPSTSPSENGLPNFIATARPATIESPDPTELRASTCGDADRARRALRDYHALRALALQFPGGGHDIAIGEQIVTERTTTPPAGTSSKRFRSASSLSGVTAAPGKSMDGLSVTVVMPRGLMRPAMFPS